MSVGHYEEALLRLYLKGESASQVWEKLGRYLYDSSNEYRFTLYELESYFEKLDRTSSPLELQLRYNLITSDKMVELLSRKKANDTRISKLRAEIAKCNKEQLAIQKELELLACETTKSTV